jgi:very-short-patch-repair endonuclease
VDGAFDDEVFFPKPSNEEQRRIVDKLRGASGVLVQGPPGTGKSHTIANLICHLLATGQRVLITAKTPRALQVLEKLVPHELRPLCINLLGGGLEEKRSLESSVGGILSKNEKWNEKRAVDKRKELERKLRELREEKSRVDRRLRDIRESEIHAQSVAEGAYRGTAARIAEAVNRHRSAYEWLTDAIPLDKSCQVTASDLRNVLAALRHFTPEKRGELRLAWPETLPTPERFSNLVQNEARATEEEQLATSGADERIADVLSRSNPAIIEAIRKTAFDFQSTRKTMMVSPHAWMRDALHDVLGGNSSLWHELCRLTRESIASIETLAAVADDTSIDFPDTTNIKTLHEDACKLKDYMKNGGRLGWWPLRPKEVKERLYVIKTVRIGGRVCSTADHFSTLSDVLHVRIECEKAWGFWVGRSDRTQGPYALQLSVFRSLRDALEDALSLDGLIAKCRETIRQCPTIDEPLWGDESQVQKIIASCRLAQSRLRKRLVTKEIQGIEAPISSIAAKTNAHPLTKELLYTIRDRNINGFADVANKIQELEKERPRLQRLDEYLSGLRRRLPRFTDELTRTPGEPHWDERLQHVADAWHWAQARYWVEEYIRKDDVPALQKRSEQIHVEMYGDEKKEVSGVIAKLASLHAWSFCVSRLTEPRRRHMEAWRKHFDSLTKSGKGKRDFRNRQAAQRSLNECKDAVPAWVMPLHRVWDTVDPAPGMFDVIIVDEASQCGYEALPLLYLGKKILIVGDEKQISPGGEFQETAPINKLINEYLYDFEFKEFFDVNVSLFAHGKLRCGTRRVRLLEHFRCMPEIIRFSNDLCYSDQPLIPLRQYGPNRLQPLERVFVSGGYRQGSTNRVINRPEADAIVEKIVELCQDKRYAEKTMGVVILQGEAQASLIESQLLERLGAAEMESRKLVCGNSYTFQGDERDIMFLSMVAAPNERNATLARDTYERSFNVAASRARDQMWLFHSVRREDLSGSCLRRRLLEFFEDTEPQKIGDLDRVELERRAAQDNRAIVKAPKPFDSWFEVDVALEIARKGFRVVPQFEVAGKYIDLVIEGGNARLAVECDGDEWHGADQYEADMQRQRQLERCRWEFFRVRECAFRWDKENALSGLWRLLEERGIYPSLGGDREEADSPATPPVRRGS